MAAARFVMFLLFSMLVALATSTYAGLPEFNIKTIKGVNGDTYDCVPVDKQPALNHPALRDHKVQMIPSQKFEQKLAKVRTPDSEHDMNKIWLLGEGCPAETIPLRRYSESSYAISPPTLSEFAGIRTTVNKQFSGASAIIDIYNPPVRDPNQYSTATISIKKGEGPTFNQIQVGWMVSPGLYNDSRTHLYGYWTKGQDTGCYNTICSGFVSVSRIMPIDFALLDISVVEGKQVDMKFSLELVPKSGWWLIINDKIKVGYWPNELFTGMNNVPADTIRWGGQVYSTTNASPPMGSGQFVNGAYEKTCYMRQVQAKSGKDFTDIDDSFIKIAESRCYFSGNNSFVGEDYRYRFVFGGTGGTSNHDCLGYEKHDEL